MGQGSSNELAPPPQRTVSRPREWRPESQGTHHAAEYATLEKLLGGIRSEKVRREFAGVAEDEYTCMEEFRIWVGTYNVNGRQPEKGLTLSQLLHDWDTNWPAKEDDDNGEADMQADIYVMGFQEIVPLNAQNIAGVWSSANAMSWDRAIDMGLNPWKKFDADDKSDTKQVENPPAENVDVIDLLSAWAAPTPSGTLKETYVAPGNRSVQSSTHGDLAGSSANPSLSSHQEPADEVHEDDPAGSNRSANLASYPLGEVESYHYDDDYVQLISRQLVGLYLSVWVRRSLLPKITGVQTTSVATGALGYLANKGAIAARMRLNDSSLVLITSHFASGDHLGDEVRRNLDFSEIMRRAEFPYERTVGVEGTLEGVPHNARLEVKQAYLGGGWGASRKVHNHESIIWLGDLNYRIQGNSKAVVQMIRADRLDRLYSHDELQRERSNEKVFRGFKEGPITFPPTYKYVRGSHYYTGEHGSSGSSSSDSEDEQTSKAGSMMLKDDAPKLSGRGSASDLDSSELQRGHPELFRSFTSERGVTESSTDSTFHHDKPKKASKKPKKIRTPSWTDRILYYTNGRLHHLLYGSCQELTMSDHKPVRSSFLLQSRCFVRESVEEHLQKCRRLVDEREMANIPRCKIEPNEIDFGSIGYKEPTTLTVSVVNTGEVPASFGFIPTESSFDRFALHQSPLPQWITATPMAGDIPCGGKVNIDLTIHVTGGTWGSASNLAAVPDGKLEEILVLRVDGGSDFFVQVSANYRPSSFGLYFEQLASQKPPKDPSRDLRSHKVDLASMRNRTASEDPLELPKAPSLPVMDEAGGTPSPSPFSSLTKTGPLPNLVEGPIGEMIPSQLSRMLHFLCDKDRLKSPKVFVKELKELMDTQESSCDKETAMVRRLVDSGNRFPTDITPSQMAKAVLSFFLDLPAPLIPESVAQAVDESKVPRNLALSLTKEAMTAVEWSVMRTTIEIFRTALTPEFVAANELTVEQVALVLSEVWFRPAGLEPGVAYSKDEMQDIMESGSHRKHRQAKYMEFFLQAPTASK